jgi:hypothetical protein
MTITLDALMGKGTPMATDRVPRLPRTREESPVCIAILAELDENNKPRYRHTVLAGNRGIEWDGTVYWNEDRGEWQESLIPVQFDGAIILRADLDRETKMKMMREMAEYAIAHIDEAQAQAREYMRKMGLSASA